jgi:hypothetical protein
VYKRLKDEDSTGMTVEIKSEAQFENDEHVFYHRDEPNEDYDSKSITGKFNI